MLILHSIKTLDVSVIFIIPSCLYIYSLVGDLWIPLFPFCRQKSCYNCSRYVWCWIWDHLHHFELGDSLSRCKSTCTRKTAQRSKFHCWNRTESELIWHAKVTVMITKILKCFSLIIHNATVLVLSLLTCVIF